MRESNPSKVDTGELGSMVIPLVEETARIGKSQVTSGKIVVKTVVETEERMLREALSLEKVDVERVPIDRVVDVAPQTRTEGDVTIVPVVEERLVVEKQLVLVEEVRIRRLTAVETVELPVQLRRERAVVERLDAAGAAMAASPKPHP
jgi:uncharacterized protein (TIGR02271 family)